MYKYRHGHYVSTNFDFLRLGMNPQLCRNILPIELKIRGEFNRKIQSETSDPRCFSEGNGEAKKPRAVAQRGRDGWGDWDKSSSPDWGKELGGGKTGVK